MACLSSANHALEVGSVAFLCMNAKRRDIVSRSWMSFEKEKKSGAARKPGPILGTANKKVSLHSNCWIENVARDWRSFFEPYCLVYFES